MNDLLQLVDKLSSDGFRKKNIELWTALNKGHTTNNNK